MSLIAHKLFVKEQTCSISECYNVHDQYGIPWSARLCHTFLELKCVNVATVMYLQIFKVRNFCGFRSWLAIHEIFILEIYWLTSHTTKQIHIWNEKGNWSNHTTYNIAFCKCEHFNTLSKHMVWCLFFSWVFIPNKMKRSKQNRCHTL